MFRNASSLLVSIYHDIGGLVKTRCNLRANGSDAKNAGYQANLSHFGRSSMMEIDLRRA